MVWGEVSWARWYRSKERAQTIDDPAEDRKPWIKTRAIKLRSMVISGEEPYGFAQSVMWKPHLKPLQCKPCNTSIEDNILIANETDIKRALDRSLKPGFLLLFAVVQTKHTVKRSNKWEEKITSFP